MSVANGGHEIDDPDWRWSWSKTNDAYTVTRPGGIQYRFETNGVLIRIETAFSNSLSLVYTNLSGLQRLAQVLHSDGRALNLSYDSSNRLEEVSASFTNISVRYDYNADGLPTNRVRTAGAISEATRYDWDGSAQVITQRIDHAGTPRVWAYDGLKGVNSYVGTGRWYEVSLDYSRHAQSQTRITACRGATNATFFQDYDPVLRKITATSDPLPSGSVPWATAGSVITNVAWYGTGDGWGVMSTNPGYAAQVLALCNSNPVPQLGWSGVRYARDDYGRVTGIEATDGTTGCSLKHGLSYDDHGRLTNVASGYLVNPTNSWQISWCTNVDMPSSVTDPEGRRREWDYTNGAVCTERAFPSTNLIAETRHAYTTNGLLAATTNANGHWVRYLTDNYGNPTSTIPQAGPTNWMAWDSLGHLKELRLQSHENTTNDPPAMVPRVIAFDPDELGRVRSITWPDGTMDRYQFDGIGNVTNHVDAAGRTNRFTWLPTRKLASTTRYLTADGSNQAATVGVDYDQQMNVVNVTDELGRTVENYTLDLQDRPVKVTNVESQQMTIVWGLGNFAQSVVGFDGTTNAFAYDAGGRLSQASYPGSTLVYGWLKNGLLATASNSVAVVTNAYDGANRLVSSGVRCGPVDKAVTYGLDLVGNATNVAMPGTGYAVSRSFDAAERLSGVVAAGVGATLSYDFANGLVSGMTLSNGVTCAYQYNKLDRLTNMVWRNASNEVLRSRAYGYTVAGMTERAETEDGGRIEYSYDSLDRLTGERRLDGYGQVLSCETYQYDLAGNRTKKTILDAQSNALVTVNYTLGAGNRLASWSVAETDLCGRVDLAGYASEPIRVDDRWGYLWVSNGVGGKLKPEVEGTNFWAYDLTVGLGTQKIFAAIRDMAGNTTYVTNTFTLAVVTNGSYQYSAAGCLTNIAYKGKDYTRTIGLSWNGQYQLTAVATNGGAAESSGYDAMGRRAWTASGGTTNWHVYDGPHVVADLDSSGGMLRSYVWGAGIDNLIAMTTYGSTTNTYYAIKDHLNSVLALVDSAGAIVEQYRYDAWGRTTVFAASGAPLASSAIGNRYCWQGREYSWNTGLYYFRARYYDSVTGRWLSSDPLGIAGGLNQYVFCCSNPVKLTDPFGCGPFDSMVSAFSGTLNLQGFLGSCDDYSAVLIPSRFMDINVSGGAGGRGLTGGVILGWAGVYPYFGFGLMFPGGFGWSALFSSSLPSTGWNVAGQVAAGLAGQGSYAFGSSGGRSSAVGVGWPIGFSGTGVYVGGPFFGPALKKKE